MTVLLVGLIVINSLILLLFAAAAALIWANSTWSASYNRLWQRNSS